MVASSSTICNIGSSSIPVLTIDGPSGSGKGTIGQFCANQLGWNYLDSGAIYRSLAWVANDLNIEAEDVDRLVQLANSLDLVCHIRLNDAAQIEVNGQMITEQLRTEEVAVMASKIAPLAPIRTALLALQHRCRKAPGLVTDGRDMGSEVFPDAQFKVFLTASAEVRAQRRFNQLKRKGFDASIARLLESIQERDARDAGRAVSPLIAADGAVIIDTSELSIDQVNDRVLNLVKNS